MAFTKYSSTDPSAPTLNGTTGTLLTVLDACLVNGYGSKSPAGWTKPFPNTSSYGMYMQGSGSVSMSLFIYDNASASLSTEAQAQGWQTITSIDNGKVTGSGQFPTTAQIAFGNITIRKSYAPLSGARDWFIYADPRTMYMFIQSDPGTHYTGFAFGDYYSLKSGSVDASRCMIMGRSAASGSSGALGTGEKLDTLSSALTTAVAGCFTPTLANSVGTSSAIAKHGDGIKGSTTALLGSVPYLNGADNGLYISPIWISDSSTGTVKGRMRGFYQFCHAISNVTDQQTFTGSGDFPNKAFIVVKQTPNAGVYFIETSDTLETNIP
jgi:hypothetical protein